MESAHPMAPGARIQLVSPGAIEAVKDDLVDVYRQAFRQAPYVKSETEVAEFARFLFAEIAVTPHAQRQGVGGRLHDRLLTGLPHRRAVLTTMAVESAANRFYAGKGWRMLLPELIVPDYSRACRVMGMQLPLIEERAP